MAAIFTIIFNAKEQELLSRFLESKQYAVFKAAPTYATYVSIAQKNPQCIIVEMPMSYLDALYLIRLVKEHKNTASIPILAYGSHSDSFIVDEFFDAGISVYCPRPLQTKSLLENIDALKNDLNFKINRLLTDSRDRCRADSGPTLPAGAHAAAPPKATPVDPEEVMVVERIMDPSTTPRERIDLIVGRIGALLAFPFTVAKVLEITQSSQTGAGDLKKAIEADPVATSRILSIANSVHFNRGGKRVSDLKDAIVRLGFTETKNVALSLSVMTLLSHDEKSVGFNRIEFWYHCLAGGIIAEQLARRGRHPQPETAFLAGLLHDFGTILLDEFFNAFFVAILRETTQSKCSFIEMERRMWGMTHNDVVARLFKEWNLPAEIIAAIEGHHTFTHECRLPLNDQDTLTAAVGMGNIIAKSLHFGRECDTVVQPIPNDFLNAFKIGESIDGDFIAEVITRVSIYNDFLKLAKKSFTFPGVPTGKVRCANILEYTPILCNPFTTYLQSQGYLLVKENNPKALQFQTPPADVIVHFVNDERDKKPLGHYLHLPVTCTPAQSETGQPPLPAFIPTIIIHAPEISMGAYGDLKHVCCLPDSLDLGLFSYAIESLIAGQPIKLPERIVSPDSSGSVLTQRPLVSIKNLASGWTIMHVYKALQISNLIEFKQTLQKLIEQKHRRIAIVLNDIEKIDGMVLSLLKNFNKRIKAEGNALSFCTIGARIDPESLCATAFESFREFSDQTALLEYFTAGVASK
jgi:HD-like signal output (HDOD) protein/DNA-binding NarL/FixJ family response regulator/anti-anti-sigma regulatory factor